MSVGELDFRDTWRLSCRHGTLFGMDPSFSLRLASRDKIAVSLKEAAQLVPFSEAYLRRAIHRADLNHLPARQIGDSRGKYFIMVDDLTEWVRNEGDPT